MFIFPYYLKQTMRTLFILLLSGFNLIAFGQIKIQPQALSSLPRNIKYLGKPAQALRYQDQTGSYLVLLTKTGVQTQKAEDDTNQAHLYAYSYKLQGATTPEEVWQLHDMVTDCPVDVIANFVSGAFKVTDLDNNGTGEVWVVYRTTCRGDVSPANLKIIMHEGTKKYAIRGTGILRTGEPLQPGDGKYSSDEAFEKGPAVIKQYGQQLWKKYVEEHIE